MSAPVLPGVGFSVSDVAVGDVFAKFGTTIAEVEAAAPRFKAMFADHPDYQQEWKP